MFRFGKGLAKFLFGSMCPDSLEPGRIRYGRFAPGYLEVGIGMPHRAVAIANEFLKMPGAKETLTQMQLQKLTYIAHGWNFVINGGALVSDEVLAWAYGPVYRDLYDHTKFFGKEPIGREITPDDNDPARFFLGIGPKKAEPYRARLTEREQQVIHHVWNRYSGLDAIRLSELTHQKGTPWFQAFSRGRDSVISNESIRRHYLQLAQRAQSYPRYYR